jgi:propanol-preferring alcohol dehydrogenase
MRAMVLEAAHSPLSAQTLPTPTPSVGQVLIRVQACAVCRTDLHLMDGELAETPYPVVPGHQVVGTVIGGKNSIAEGTRVGVPWLGYTCGRCAYCRSGQENLCDSAQFTGYTLPGGYAEYLVADARYCFPLDTARAPAEQAPLLCAGLIGYRALRMCAGAERVGLYGFGAAAHILAQVLAHQGRAFYAFTRPGDLSAQAAASDLGAAWVGGSDQRPDEALDAAIIFAPVGELVPAALRTIRKGAVVVCGGIHMSDIPSFPYALLWGERQVRSVANLTRQDGVEFLRLAETARVRTKIERFPLRQANEALAALRAGTFTGSAVLTVGED